MSFHLVKLCVLRVVTYAKHGALQGVLMYYYVCIDKTLPGVAACTRRTQIAHFKFVLFKSVLRSR